MNDGQDWIVAVAIATEVPPNPAGDFTADQILVAIHAVCDVIRNRVASPGFPKSPVEVVLQRNQFSAVCQQEYWRQAMAGNWFPGHVQRCLDAWRDPTWPHFDQHVLWYYSPVSMIPKDSQPRWLDGKEEVVIPGLSQEYFRFYKEAD